jgi:hypothetical protein
MSAAAGGWARFIIVLQRCCGAAAQMALEQMPCITDPQTRDALTSWARLGDETVEAAADRCVAFEDSPVATAEVAL